MFDNPLTRVAVAILLALVIFAVWLPLMPQIDMPEQISSSFYFLLSKMWEWDFILPVGLMLQYFSWWFRLEIILMSLTFLLFLWRIFTKKS